MVKEITAYRTNDGTVHTNKSKALEDEGRKMLAEAMKKDGVDCFDDDDDEHNELLDWILTNAGLISELGAPLNQLRELAKQLAESGDR